MRTGWVEAMMRIASTAALAALVHSASGFVDTEDWVGAEYTPAAAPGNGYVRAPSSRLSRC